MTVLLSPVVLQLAGAVIVGAVFIQSMFLIVSSFRRLAVEREQRDLFLNALRHRSATALAESRQEMKRTDLSWNGFRKFRVQRKEKEIEGVHSFYLIPHDGKPLPPFLPGQYLTFQLRLPDLQKPIIRCYSLSDSPDRFYYYRVSIKKIPPPPKEPDAQPGLSSSYFNDFLEEGDILDVKAPSGQFVLDATSELPIVLIGGGIGITPVLSMLNALCDSGARREIWFFLGVRNGAEHLMKDHLEELERDNDNLHLHVCYSEPRIAGKDEDITVVSGNAKRSGDRARLICTKTSADAGVEVGHVLELSASVEFSIGRGEKNTLSISSDELSRNHLKISFSNGYWTAEDVGSTNGTFINGDKVQSGNLKAGDSLGFGGLEFDFQMQEASFDNGEPRGFDEEGRDYHHSGHVSVDLMKELLPSNNYAFYICGPPPMMEFLTAGLKDWGVPDSDIHFEAFGPATVKKTKTEIPVDSTTTLEVVFDRSGKTVKWDPTANSLLDFAEDNGIVIESGCRAGNCGTCVTAIKSGEVSYVAEPGSAPEDGSCLTCVSVPKTSLTLDA